MTATTHGHRDSTPDLRLAGFATALWLCALAALHLSSRASVTAGACTLAAALLIYLLARRASRAPEGLLSFRWFVTALLLGAACGFLATGARARSREAEPLATLVSQGASVRADLVLRDDPRALDASAGRLPTYLASVTLGSIRVEGEPVTRVSARALLLGTDPAWRSLLPGQRVEVSARLLPPRGGDLTAAVLSVRDPPILHGHSSWAQRAAGALRAGLRRACEPLPDDVGGLLPGLVVGDTSHLDPALEEDFRAVGLTHLNAVSGANLAIVLGVVLHLVRWTRAGPVTTALICVAALVGFVILARPSPSVVRAGAMGAIALLALAVGRPRAALPALAAGVAALIVVDPELAGDAGFALSTLATGGLLLLAPPWRDALHRRRWPLWAAEALAVPAAAQVACGPVVTALAGNVSLVAVPANLLVVPAIAPATLLGVGAAVLSPWWPAGAEFAAWLGQWPARWLVVVAERGARVPAGAVPWPAGVTGGVLLGLLTVALLVAARKPLVRRLVAIVAAGAMIGALPVRLLAAGWPPPGWIVVACAVGQGDAVVLPAGPGRAVVVDAGPDAEAVDGCLRRLGVRRIALLVISHFHVDHIGGLEGVYRQRTVERLLIPSWPDPPASRATVVNRAAAARSPVTVAHPGQHLTVGDLSLTVVGPLEELHGTNSDPNNNSLIVHAVVAGRAVLLPGDAETEEQQSLLNRLRPGSLHADVLKVPHHGSAYQLPAFLDAVDPTIALVSVGLGNDYGHPNGPLLAHLTRGGTHVIRTDQLGDLAALQTPTGLALTARGDPPPP